MARDFLQNLADWKLVYDYHDLRGRSAYDETGRLLGRVQDMIADTDVERVVAVTLDNGSEYPADLIDNNLRRDRIIIDLSKAVAVTLDAAEAVAADPPEADTSDTSADAPDAAEHAAPTASASEVLEDSDEADGQSSPAASATPATTSPHAVAHWADGWAKVEPALRTWHAASFGGSAFDDYAPFYKYGFESGRRDAYLSREWASLEKDMRADYEGHYGAGTWGRVRQAVKEGFLRARGRGATPSDPNADSSARPDPSPSDAPAAMGLPQGGDAGTGAAAASAGAAASALAARAEGSDAPKGPSSARPARAADADAASPEASSGPEPTATSTRAPGAAGASRAGDDAEGRSGESNPRPTRQKASDSAGTATGAAALAATAKGMAPTTASETALKRTGWYELYIADNGEHAFALKAANGQVILDSETYTSRAGAENGIASVRKNSPLPERYERAVSANGKPIFHLKSANHHVIATSEEYESEAGREKGIESVMRNGPSEIVKDKTGA